MAVLATANGASHLEQAVVGQLAQSYKRAVEGPDPQRWSIGLYRAPACNSNIISSPLASLLVPSKFGVSANTRGISVGLIIPYDLPGFNGQEMLARSPVEPVESEDGQPKTDVTLGLGILLSQALNIPRSSNNSAIDPARSFTLAQYWATTPYDKERTIVRRRIVGTSELARALKSNFITADTDPLAVAASALRWVSARYKTKK